MVRWLLVLVLSVPLTSHAYCRAPSFPMFEPRAPVKPSKPFCASMGTCTELDVQMYSRSLDAWVDELRRYVRQAQETADSYVQEAVRFAQCELDQ